MKRLVALLLGVLCVAAHASPLFSPYKDIHAAAPLVNGGISQLPAGVHAISLAFATGECGAERWAGLDAQQVAGTRAAALHAAGVAYMISTGGEGGVFTCASDAGMDAFMARYASPSLLGIDFDIEAGQSAQTVHDLVRQAKRAQARQPQLRYSFTLATLGASDGSGTGLNAHGVQVMAALQAAHMARFHINLMVMNYGPALSRNCVVRAGRCDMAASAQQAVMNFHRRYRVPLSRIEVTAMLGVNDVVDNIFTPADAYRLARFVRQRRLGGLHYWSLDRDLPCAAGAPAVSPQCSGLNTVAASAFVQAFLRGLR